jgi:hypothetical protein
VSRHGASFRIVGRNPNVWQAKCGRHAAWTGPTYEAVEDSWREHVWAETGKAPPPGGETLTDRWSPEVSP